ncbi:MAG: 30S ribosomal protein S1 [Alphaproteobacteria bacterium]
MSEATAEGAGSALRDEFAALLDESFSERNAVEGSVITGKVIAIENDLAIIDVGLKAEGRVPLHEFAPQGQEAEIGVGDDVEVYLERMENAMGEAVISRERARREEAWDRLESASEGSARVDGVIFGRVKGGFTVDLDGAVAFLPGSQVDIRPVRDITPLMGIPQPFQILKMDRRRGNIVVSRRAVLEETRAEQRTELLANLHEGQVLDGVVKNITDYGAFVDLGGIDGLLHVTDMSWRRINHPSEVVTIGETLKVQVIKVNPETQRISLGMKQLEADPWDSIEAKYPVRTTFTGRVTNITDYGAFVELEPGVEGLVHVSEMSWTKKNVHPGKIVSQSQEVDVMILDVDPSKRRISLGLKQVQDNPWDSFAANFPAGTEVEGQVKNITEFGLFIGLEDDLDGMIHLSDLDWNRSGDEALQEYKKGDTVRAIVLDIDVEKERIGLGIKQLGDDPFASVAGLKRGEIVTCTVTAVQEPGLEVIFGDTEYPGYIRRGDLARDRADQRPDRFAKGDKVDAMVTNMDRSSRRVTLSIKALEIEEEKKAVEQYGSTDSGASLGDILGAAMDRARTDTDDEGDDSK